jgi:hypothetical protein
MEERIPRVMMLQRFIRCHNCKTIIQNRDEKCYYCHHCFQSFCENCYSNDADNTTLECKEYNQPIHLDFINDEKTLNFTPLLDNKSIQSLSDVGKKFVKFVEEERSVEFMLNEALKDFPEIKDTENEEIFKKMIYDMCNNRKYFLMAAKETSK